MVFALFLPYSPTSVSTVSTPSLQPTFQPLKVPTRDPNFDPPESGHVRSLLWKNPTSKPSPQPTSSPTPAPSPAPSPQPPPSPTPAPSLAPSPAPSPAPSLAPSPACLKSIFLKSLMKSKKIYLYHCVDGYDFFGNFVVIVACV